MPAELPAHLAAPLASGADAPVGSLVGATPLGGPLAPDATIAGSHSCDFVSALIALGFFIANGRGILSPRAARSSAPTARPTCVRCPTASRRCSSGHCRVLLRRSYHWVHAERAALREHTAEKERRVQILELRAKVHVYTAVCGVRSRDDALADARAALGTLQKLLARKEREVLDRERRLPARLRLADDEIVNLRTPGPAARRPARRRQRRRQHDARQRRRAV